jgi:Cu/Ag efflux protein CusF
MPPMTMEFHVVNRRDLDEISAGANVEGNVTRKGDDYWVDHLRKVAGH